MNQEQIAKLKELAQAAENEVIRSHGWAGSVEMLETLRIDEEYLTAASPAAILELIALAERTTSPVSQMTEHKGAAQIHRSNDKGASNQGHKPLPIAKDSLLVRKVHPAPVEGTFTRGEARAAVLAVAAAAPHAQAAAPVAEQKWPESEAFKYINQKVAEQMSPAPKSAQPQPVAEQGGLPRAIGVSRDAESPGMRGVLVAFERPLSDDELRRLHDLLAAIQQAAEPVAWPSNEELQALWDESHVGHPVDFAADVLERWGGCHAGLLGNGAATAIQQPQAHTQRRIGSVAGNAAADVLAERRRQVEAEDWTPEHDDGHPCGEIAAFAAVYAMPPAARDWPATETGYGDTFGAALCPVDWTPKFGDRRRELVKAGALILAEIERIDRAALAKKGGAA